jgi:hypothetical protein
MTTFIVVGVEGLRIGGGARLEAEVMCMWKKSISAAIRQICVFSVPSSLLTLLQVEHYETETNYNSIRYEKNP